MDFTKVIVRDYSAADLERVKKIHEDSGLDYRLPDLSSPLFLITKVVEYDGTVQACAGMYLQAECYLWLDRSDWASPDEKLELLKALDRIGMQEAWLRGLDCACLWLPPGMDRFGERLIHDLGWKRDRAGWVTYSKKVA